MSSTHTVSALGGFNLPDSVGNVWFEPASLTQTNDRYPQMVARFANSATKDVLGGRFVIPSNYSAAPYFTVVWTSTVTSGNVIWTFDYSQTTAGGTLDPGADTESITTTSAAPGTSQLAVESIMSATATNLIAGRQIEYALGRNGAGADTMAGDAAVYNLLFSYSD